MTTILHIEDDPGLAELVEDAFKSFGFRGTLPPASPHAVVVVVHGFLAHSGLYEWTGEQLAARGFAVHAVDLRGHGKSEGERLFVNAISEYVDDVDAHVRVAKGRHPGLPVFMIAHSAGGVVGCMYALEHQAELAGLVCESFAHEVPAPDIALTVIKGLSHIAPRLHVLKLDHDDYSRDPAFTARIKNDPLISKERYPAQSVAELARADDRLRKELGRITLPLLILHGTEDRVTKRHGSEVFAQRAGATDKTLVLYEGHWHDLLNDVGKERVLNDIVDWIQRREHAAAA